MFKKLLTVLLPLIFLPAAIAFAAGGGGGGGENSSPHAVSVSPRPQPRPDFWPADTKSGVHELTPTQLTRQRLEDEEYERRRNQPVGLVEWAFRAWVNSVPAGGAMRVGDDRSSAATRSGSRTNGADGFRSDSAAATCTDECNK